MKTIQTSAGALAYDVRGAGKTVVLLPSAGHDRHDFDELRSELGDAMRTVALDWPGHGDSPPSSGPTSAMAFADAAEQAIAQLAPEGAIVLGNSVGGFAATRLAIRRPELVEGLVIVDGGGFVGRGPHIRAVCAAMGRPRFLRAIYPAFSRHYMRARTDADRRSQASSVATTRAEPGLSAVSGVWRSFPSPEHDLRNQAARITAPTLVVWGKRDPVIPLRIGRRIAASIPAARLEVLDCGHVPFTSYPQRFAELLLGFASEIPSAPAAASPTAA
jgi:pimeloyl-ACP methyl ester carboxylesterase